MNRHIEAAVPGLVPRLLRLFEAADRDRGWGVWDRLRAVRREPAVRCAELIRYEASA